MDFKGMFYVKQYYEIDAKEMLRKKIKLYRIVTCVCRNLLYPISAPLDNDLINHFYLFNFVVFFLITYDYKHLQ